MRSFNDLVKKRNEKREKQLEKLEEKRQSQWEDELLKCVISALPRSTPKKIQEILEGMERTVPTDYQAAKQAQDAIGL